MYNVVLDIGHGGRDPGALGKTTYEKNNNLILGLKVGKILQQHDMNIHYTRTTDKDFCSGVFDVNVDLLNRITIAKQFNPDVFVSLHNNSFNTQAKGNETHCYKSAGSDYRLAESIQSQMASLLEMIDRGVKISNLYVTRKFDKTITSACLVEYGFIDSEEAVILAKMDIAAVAIAKGVLNFLGINYNGTINIQPSSIITLTHTTPSNFSYDNNAKCINSDLPIRDINGNILSGRYVSNGDNITVLDVSYSKQLALVEYPTSSGVVRSGYIKLSSNINYYFQNQWENGSSSETVYDNVGSTIGRLEPGESATPLYRKNGKLHVVYTTVKGVNTKSGYVQYNGKFTKF